MNKNKLMWICLLISSFIWSAYYTFSDKFTDYSNLEIKPITYFNFECRKDGKVDNAYFRRKDGFVYLPLINHSCEEFTKVIKSHSDVLIEFSRKGIVTQLLVDNKKIINSEELVFNYKGRMWGIASFGYIMLILSIVKLYQMHRKKRG